MKKSKFIRAVAAITMSAVSTVACFGTAACTKTHNHTWGDYVTDDYGHYRVCTSCNLKETYAAHSYDGNYTCTVCDYQHSHSFGDSGDCSCGLHEHQYSSTISYDYDYHWYESTCGHDDAVVKEPHTYVNHECSVCHVQESTVASYEFNPAVIGATSSLSSAWTDGMWTVSSGTEIRGRNISSVTDVETNEVVATPGTDGEGAVTHSVKMGNDTSTLTLNANGAGTLIIWVSNGSTGKDTGAIKINGTSFTYGGSGGYQIRYSVPKAGTYTISRNGTVNGTSDIYYACFTAVVPVTAVESIEIANAGVTEYYEGQEFTSEGLAVNAVYETTGVKTPVTGFTVDSSEFKSEEGEYIIKVSYNSAADDNKLVETSYKVRVYSYQSISLTDRYTVKEAKNTSAGNGVYATHVLRTFYLLGDEFNGDGLVVTLTGKCGTTTDTFVLSANDYTISGYDKTKSGKQTLTVTAGTINQTFDVYVADFAASSFASEAVAVRVNKTLNVEQSGTLNGDGEYQFNSITNAIEFLESLQAANKLPANSTIYLDAGQYDEKLEIRIPNLTIVGAGAASTKIEYNELWGVADATGFVHTTDSTATLNVRESAVNFTIKDVTISNYYNTSDSFVGSISPKGERALAMLIQADKTIVQNCVLLGWQDTLELFTGRQYFVNSVIKGTTDFIFGTNNTTYFYQCEIQTIINKNTNGGGYITAMKGQNKGSSDKITYGIVFDDCDFTFENGVPAGTTAIGRTWGADAAVMIMNSRLGAHISTTYNKRYVSMNNNDPAKAQFMEYNNTGAGATSSSSNNYWTIPTAETAANYNNLSVIFGKTNGLVNYSDVWNVNKTVTVHYGEGGTATAELPYGAKATYSKLVAGVVLPQGYGIEGVYSDSAMTQAFDYNAPVTENTDVYVKLEQLVDVDVNIKDLLAGGVTYTSASGAASTLNSCLGTGAAYDAGSIDLTNGIAATFDGGYVKINNVKPNNTAVAWNVDWSGVDGADNYDTYITLGNVSAANRNLAITVKAGCTIKVYCAATAAGRTATIGTAAEACAANATANGTTILGAATATADGVGFILEATVTEAGTYYVNCSTAISFFRIVVDY